MTNEVNFTVHNTKLLKEIASNPKSKSCKRIVITCQAKHLY